MTTNPVRRALRAWVAQPLLRFELGAPWVVQAARLQKSQWASREALEATQNRKLVRLITHLSRHVPFYRAFMRTHGLTPDHFRGPVDLSLLPIATKSLIRQNFNSFVSERRFLRRTSVGSTGGTTGQSFTFIKDWRSITVAEACRTRARRWAGVEPGDREVLVSFNYRVSWKGQLRSRLLNSFPELGSEDLATTEELLRRIRRLQPRCLDSYASVIYRLAQVARRARLSVTIPTIFSTGDVLHHHMREEIQRAFGARVFDYYGSTEVGGVAFECEEGRRHISDEHVMVETVNEAGEPVRGVSGHIALTDLDNYAFPFVRYLNGDRAILSDETCPCGRTLSVLPSLEGRDADCLRTVSGDTIPGIYFPAVFKNLTHVRQYQIVQKADGSVEVFIVPGEESVEHDKATMKEELLSKLGASTRVTFLLCDSIPTTATGKVRLVVSNIGRPP